MINLYLLSLIEKDICNMKCYYTNKFEDPIRNAIGRAKYEAYADVQKFMIDIIYAIRDNRKVNYKSLIPYDKYHINKLLPLEDVKHD